MCVHGEREGKGDRVISTQVCYSARVLDIVFVCVRGDSSTLLNVVEMAAIIWNVVANFQLKWCNKWNPSTSTKNERKKVCTAHRTDIF